MLETKIIHNSRSLKSLYSLYRFIFPKYKSPLCIQVILIHSVLVHVFVLVQIVNIY